MWRYILKRILMMFFVVIAASIIIFSILYFVPGDPAQIILGETATAEEIEYLREQLGLNGSYLSRLINFLKNAFLKFDFGISYSYGQPVMKVLLSRLPRTLILGWMTIILQTVIGLPLGIMAALHQNKWQDHLCMFIALLGVSIPGFWLALMMIILFSVKLKWLPSFGIGGIEYYIMPVIAGSLSHLATQARQMRSSMLETIRSDYVTTARAKGLPESKVVLKHMLPNALIPVITLIGGSFGRSLAGTVIIEQVFSIPGMGTYMLEAVNHRDYPVVQGAVIFLAAVTAVTMLLVDIAYGVVDPRIKAQYVNSSRRVKK